MEKEVILKPILIEDLGRMYTTENNKCKRRYAIYKCGFCDNEFKSQVQHINSGATISCGCYKSSKLSNRNKTHGLSSTRLHRIWSGIKDRILNSKHKQYNDYGGRGITICDDWKNDFMSFYKWAMSNGYSDELSIDRIDTNGNYEPSNCRWTTSTIQNRNQRLRKDNTSGYKGVSFNKNSNLYGVIISVNKKGIKLGYYKTAVEAGIAYNNYIIENNLEGFILNEIPQEYTEKEITNE